MKKHVFRLLLLAAVIGLAASPLDVTPAYGYGPICQSIQGGACSPDGRELSCTDALDGGPGLCVCTDGFWSC